MKALTFWTLLFIVMRLLALAAYGANDAIQAGNGVRVDFDNIDDPLTIFAGLSAAAYVAISIVSGILSLCWIYGATRNALSFEPHLDISPGWAVGWFFVPVYGLFKPFQYLSEVWKASLGPKGVDADAPRFMLAWWLLNVFGNVALTIASRLEKTSIAAGMTGDLAIEAAGLALVFSATLVFFKIVRDIHRNQLNTHSGLNTAEVF